jgi:hypothetical protein
MPSPGDPQAERTIDKAINGGFDLLEAKCNRCDRVSLVALRALTAYRSLFIGHGPFATTFAPSAVAPQAFE